MSTHAPSLNTTIEFDTVSDNEVTMIMAPLQKGHGTNLAVLLRRIVINSLTGCAVVEAKIEGALHEYATLEGVEEDVLAILSNLSESAFALTGDREEVTLELTTNQPGPVKLKIIDLPHDVEVANPEHIIAHLTQPRDFKISFKVARGQGEHMAKDYQARHAQLGSDEEITSTEVNTLYLNAIFNPVKNVSYTVENFRVGEKTDLDMLKFTVKTNGTLSAKSALTEAASIAFYQGGLKLILDLEENETSAPAPEEKVVDPVLLESIDTLYLGSRSTKCLKAESIHFIGDLVTKTREDLLLTPNLGKRSLEEIETALHRKSLALGVSLPEWPPADLIHTPEVETVGDEFAEK